MKLWSSLSLNKKLFLSLNLLIVGTLLSGGVFFLNYTIDKNTKSLETRMKVLADTIAIPAGKYIWDLNTEALEFLTTKIMEDEEIHKLDFKDNENKSIVDMKVKERGDVKVAESEIMSEDGSQSLGKLQIFYNLDKIEKNKTSIINMFFGATALLVFLINFILFFILKKIISTLNRLTENLGECGHSVIEESELAYKYAEEVNTNTLNTAKSTDETASAVVEITSMVEANLEKINTVTALTVESEDKAGRCKIYLKELDRAMGEITSNNNLLTLESNSNNQKISEILVIMNKIKAKTNIIDDLVFQTKLLSFNASVEASRAGEHGKGFAVVAEEMANLSQVIKDASNEISNIVSESVGIVEVMVKTFTERMFELTSSNKEKIQVGLSKSAEVGDALVDLVENVTAVNQNIGQVRAASEEQSHGVKSISDSISEIQYSTNSNSELAQKTLLTTTTLKSIASSLFESLNDLNHIVYGIKSENQGVNIIVESGEVEQRESQSQSQILDQVEDKLDVAI